MLYYYNTVAVKYYSIAKSSHHNVIILSYYISIVACHPIISEYDTTIWVYCFNNRLLDDSTNILLYHYMPASLYSHFLMQSCYNILILLLLYSVTWIYITVSSYDCNTMLLCLYYPGTLVYHYTAILWHRSYIYVCKPCRCLYIYIYIYSNALQVRT